jgi:hypothetical protein
MNLFPVNAVADFTNRFVSMLTSDIPALITLIAFIVGLSFTMAIIDTAKEGNLSGYRKHR